MEVKSFLDMVKKEAAAADSMSSWLNGFQIALLIIVALATFASTIAAALSVWQPWQRAIVAGVPGLGAALLAVVNPRVDWHRTKEIELNVIYSAVVYQQLPLKAASERYWYVRRALEFGWQKSKSAIPEPAPSSDRTDPLPGDEREATEDTHHSGSPDGSAAASGRSIAP